MSSLKKWIESVEHKTKDELMELVGHLSNDLKKAEDAVKKTSSELIKEGKLLYEKYIPQIQKAICSNDKITAEISDTNIKQMADLISTTLDASIHIKISPKIIDTFCVMILKEGLKSYCKNYHK